jgi:hypothetical protein
MTLPDAPAGAHTLQTLLLPRPACVALVPRKPGDVCVAKRDRNGTASALIPSSPKPAKLQPIKSVTFSVTRGAGSFSPSAHSSDFQASGVEVLDLPLGISRILNAATLKAMLKAHKSDVLFRKLSDGTWDICDDSHRVDLLDGTVEYRLGDVQIFS